MNANQPTLPLYHLVMATGYDAFGAAVFDLPSEFLVAVLNATAGAVAHRLDDDDFFNYIFQETSGDLADQGIDMSEVIMEVFTDPAGPNGDILDLFDVSTIGTDLKL